MADALRFCVVTPSYHQGPFLERTIRSVLEQEIEDLDYIVVDGGSTDETVSILRRFEGHLRFVSEADEGQAHAVNKGLERTRAELIGWLNSDDIYYPGALAKVRAAFAAHPEADVIYGDANHIDLEDAVIEPYYTEAWDARRLEDVCFLCQPAVFFRRRVVERCRPLDARLRFALDYEYWLRLARYGMRFLYLRELLAGSRLYPENKTLGQRLAVHAEINLMTRRRLGKTPDRWLSNYAHVFLETRGLERKIAPFRFSLLAAVFTWLAALRFNGRVERSLWRTGWGWIRESYPRTFQHSPRRRLSRPGAERTFRVGFDISQTGTEKAGCGYEADSLIQALAETDERNEYVLYPTFGDAYWDPEGPEATRRIEHPRFLRGIAQTSPERARQFWRRPAAHFEAQLGCPDIVHSHNFFCPTGLARARLVYTVHDLAFLEHPEWTTERNRQTCFEGVLNASLYADFVLADSESTRRHFLKSFPYYPEERTAVAYLASRFTDPAPIPRPPTLAHLQEDGFFLSVGTVEPRKNQIRLLRAYRGYAEKSERPYPLVLTGGQGWLMEEFEEELQKAAAEPIHQLGYVSDTELRWLYQHCFVFLYPSLFEGFGLPVAEALSQGAAVLTSPVTSLSEVAGEAALYVDPLDVQDIERGLLRVSREEELRRSLRAKARTQAAKFSWHKTARQVLRCYESVLGMEAHQGGDLR